MKTLYRIAISIAIMGSAPSMAATVVPIDPAIFSIVSGTSAWTGNTLTLTFGGRGEVLGAFVQTKELPLSELPKNVIGISFEIQSTISNPRISFGYLAYDNSFQGKGSLNLVNYLNGTPWDLTTFVRQRTGFGDGGSTSDSLISSLGSSYSPFSLSTDSAPLTTFPLFSLDFRADGHDGDNDFAGTVTFANINWLTSDSNEPNGPVSQTPIPPAVALMLSGLAVISFLGRRRGLSRLSRDATTPNLLVADID